VTELLALNPSRFYGDSYNAINFSTGDFDWLLVRCPTPKRCRTNSLI
jgi:hypothetical protein